MDRQLVSSGARWEEAVAYSRAVRVGPWAAAAIVLDGPPVRWRRTAATVGGGPVGGDDAGAQAREALRRIEVALEGAGARLEHVVRTRMYVTDISRWEQVGRVHGEVFRDIRPATAM